MILANDNQNLDIIGVGIGPFNLSLAALLSPSQRIQINSCFFDQKKSFAWHPGMLLEGAEIQVNYLKDLVTLVDPTNPYSFIAYLAKHKRLYRFINSRFNYVLRAEFEKYLQWVSISLPNLFFQEAVEDIQFQNDQFNVTTTKRNVKTQHLVLGTGLSAYVPDCAKPFLGPHVFHSSEFLTHVDNLAGQRVVVVGGGQSGAEIIHYLLSQRSQYPKSITWVTKRNQFLPIDDSPFVNDLFTPNYTEQFFKLNSEMRANLLQEQILASDGVSLHLLQTIYQCLYKLEFLEHSRYVFNFIMTSSLVAMKFHQNKYQLKLAYQQNAATQSLIADVVILCTGYRWQFPNYLSTLQRFLHFDNGHFKINADYSIQWDGPKQNRIYVQNAARHTHGIADPNLSLMAWRSAKIINSIAGDNIYDVDNENTAIDWVSCFSNLDEVFKHVANA